MNIKRTLTLTAKHVAIQTIPFTAIILALIIYAACSSSIASETPQTPETYTVTFNTNGGSEVASEKVNSGDTVARPDNPTKTDSIFANWFTDDALTNIYSFSSPVTSDLTLYAKWIPQDAMTYQVAFNTRGGNSIGTQPIVDGQMASKPDNPTRIGYRFDEWYRNPSLSDDPYDFENTAITANITLYAKWIKTFAVVFDLNIGEGATRTGEDEAEEIDDVLPEVVDSSARAAKPSEVPTRQGYRFLNWYSNRNAPSTAYDFENTAVTGNVILYAKWQRTFTVTFNTNKGDDLRTEAIDSGLVAVEQPTDTINTEHGGTFVGWYSDEELTLAYNDFSTPVIQDLSLYAKWRYMVTYDTATRAITGLVGGRDIANGDVDLVIPSNVNGVMMDSIRRSAFDSNTRIVSLRIAEGIKYIGAYAFAVLRMVRLGFSGSTFISANFEEGGVEIISRIVGDLVIPNSVETIGERAFVGCSGFTGDLTIPNSVKTIGAAAFGGCSGFNGRLTISDSVKTIREGTFWSCENFTGDLTIPNSVKTIEYGAFSNCSGFTGDLTIPNSVETIGKWAFYKCIGFSGSLTIDDGVETIGERAFFGCSSFTGSLTIGNSVETIGLQAFDNCTGFTGSLTIPNSVKTIGNSAFGEMTGIDSFVFKNSTPPASIGENIFQDITLTELDIRVPDAEAVTAYRAVANLAQYSTRIRAAQ